MTPHLRGAVHPKTAPLTPKRNAREPLKPEARLSLLLLRSIRRVRIRFARNRFLPFRRLRGFEFLIGSASAKDHRAASEENQTQVFHAHINNRRSPDFQQRYRFTELAKLWVTRG